jgi:hypothetical protein
MKFQATFKGGPLDGETIEMAEVPHFIIIAMKTRPQDVWNDNDEPLMPGRVRYRRTAIKRMGEEGTAVYEEE